MNDQQRTVYLQGKLATLNDNPYPADSDNYYCWAHGFKAFVDDEEDY